MEYYFKVRNFEGWSMRGIINVEKFVEVKVVVV